MKKQIFIGVFIFLIIGGYVMQKKMNDGANVSTLILNNIEALAMGETDTKDYWCCGNTDTCVKGPDFEIKGKFQETPCK